MPRIRDYKKEMEAVERKQMADLKKRAPKFPVPKGFTAAWAKDDYGGRGEIFVMKNDDNIEFRFYAGGDGTTRFKVADGWRTFDRTGVESSFYWRKWDYKGAETPDLNAMYAEHLERIAKSREFHKTALVVPCIGFSISPDSLVTRKRDLTSKKGCTMFTPSGFGTGYTIWAKSAPRRRFGIERAKPELEKFFGVAPLFIERMDCD